MALKPSIFTYLEFQVDNQTIFPAQEMYQQLHEYVENICLVTIISGFLINDSYISLIVLK